MCTSKGWIKLLKSIYILALPGAVITLLVLTERKVTTLLSLVRSIKSDLDRPPLYYVFPTHDTRSYSNLTCKTVLENYSLRNIYQKGTKDYKLIHFRHPGNDQGCQHSQNDVEKYTSSSTWNDDEMVSSIDTTTLWKLPLYSDTGFRYSICAVSYEPKYSLTNQIRNFEEYSRLADHKLCVLSKDIKMYIPQGLRCPVSSIKIMDLDRGFLSLHDHAEYILLANETEYFKIDNNRYMQVKRSDQEAVKPMSRLLITEGDGPCLDNINLRTRV